MAAPAQGSSNYKYVTFCNSEKVTYLKFHIYNESAEPMHKLQADPKVLAALSAAFPKPKSAASKALEKYLTVLGTQFDLALLHGRTTEQVKLGLYAVSIYYLTQKGGHIGPQRMRLHLSLIHI